MKLPNKILIIEDDQPLRDALKDALTREGFECFCAEDGEDGLKLALKQKPDLIMLDLALPKMDGFEMLKKLRGAEWGSTARVLILTNLSADNSKRMRAAIDTYPESYMIKSNWSIANIIKKTKEMLSI